jgi:hypothetical protein
LNDAVAAGRNGGLPPFDRQQGHIMALPQRRDQFAARGRRGPTSAYSSRNITNAST